MKEEIVKPANRCFGNCPQVEEQKIKDVLTSAKQHKKHNKEINILLAQFRGKGIIDLLPMIGRRYPHLLEIALERAERRYNVPGSNEALYLAQFKMELKKPK
jgi:hypothetical protein